MRALLLTAAVVLFLLSFQQFTTMVSADTYWKDCSAASDRLKISNIVVNPYPAIKGQLVNISLTAVVSSPIDQLNAEIDSLFIKKHYNLCDPQFSKYVNCPVPAGNLFVQISEPVPQIPVSKATAKVFLRDSQGIEVSCTILYLQFK